MTRIRSTARAAADGGRRPGVSARLLAGLIVLVLAGVVVPGGGRAQPPYGPPPVGAPGGYMRLRLIRVFDQSGFHQPVEAYRLLAPVDWRVEPWVRWRQDGIVCTSNLIDAGARLTAPDGITGLEFFPTASWRWMDDPQSREIIQRGQPGCPWLPHLTAPDYLRSALPRVRPGAQLVGSWPDQRLSAAIDAELRMALAPSIQAGYVHGIRVDAGRFRLSYLLNGRPVDEMVSGVLRVVAQRSPSYGQVTGQAAGPLTTFGVTASPWIAGRAPQGRLEPAMPLFATIVGSITPNLQWVHAVQLVSNNLGNIRLKGEMDRQRIWYQAQQEIGQIYSQAWQNQQRVQASLAQQYSESVRGIETFVDRISGERVELPGGYTQAWSNNRGEYILSNDPNFNPGVALREPWEAMPRIGRQ